MQKFALPNQGQNELTGKPQSGLKLHSVCALFKVAVRKRCRGASWSHLGMLMSLLRGRRATLLKAILTPTATTSVKEITPPIT